LYGNKNVNGRGIEKIYHFSFAEVINFQWGRFVTVIIGFILLVVKILYLID